MANGIHVLYNSRPLIKNTIILRSTEDGFYSSQSTPTLINVTIDGGNYGIATSSSGTVTAINCTIKNTNLWDVSCADTDIILINSSFNHSKTTFPAGTNSIIVKWHLHVYVEDSNHQPIPAADVRVRDNENGTYDENFSTDGNGYVRWIVLTEYTQTDKNGDEDGTDPGEIVYYTPYNITVNYTGLNFSNNPRDSDMNTSKTEVFTATSPVPEFGNIMVPLLITITLCILFIHHQKTHYTMKKERKVKRRNKNERK